jgi:hypothetical protein
LDKDIILANVGSNKVIVAGQEFLLTGVNGATTNTLDFVYTVQDNDKISVQDFDFYFDSKDDIVLTDIKDKDGNTIDFSSIILSSRS